MVLKSFLCLIITLFVLEVYPNLNYNQDCKQDLRRIGLPRIWRYDDDKNYPLKEPLTILTSTQFGVTMKNTTDNSTEYMGEWLGKRPLLLPCLPHDSPQLITIIREMFLKKKTTINAPHNLTFPVAEFIRDPVKYTDPQPIEVDDLVFKGKVKNGFFIEAGAHDFQFSSNSLYFELKYNWTGLLVEPHQLYYQRGLKTNRNVYSAEACFSFEQWPTLMVYSLDNENMINVNDNKDDRRITCLPLYSLLLAVGNPTVNYLSLDIEGGEFQVLKTVPWKKVDIQVISIESHFIGVRTEGSLDEVKSYMINKGYLHVPGAHKAYLLMNGTYTGVQGFVTNELFVRTDIAKEAGLTQQENID